jgi:hypothetical protein
LKQKSQKIKFYLPIVGAADYKAASTVKLYIKDGGDLVGGVVGVAEDRLHALKVAKLG